jgi:hypothetical protein
LPVDDGETTAVLSWRKDKRTEEVVVVLRLQSVLDVAPEVIHFVGAPRVGALMDRHSELVLLEQRRQPQHVVADAPLSWHGAIVRHCGVRQVASTYETRGVRPRNKELVMDAILKQLPSQAPAAAWARS